MNEPRRLDADEAGQKLSALSIVRVPKKCWDPPNGCGKRYVGNALSPLSEGEEYLVHPCDDCITTEEERQTKMLRGEAAPILELERPHRARTDLE